MYFVKPNPVHSTRAGTACGVQDLKLGPGALVVWVLKLEVTNMRLF